MADLAGTHELGPGSAGSSSRPGAQEWPARAGHDLTLEVAQWPARVTVPDSGESDSVTLTAELDLGFLTVREGTAGGAIEGTLTLNGASRPTRREVTIEEIPNGRA